MTQPLGRRRPPRQQPTGRGSAQGVGGRWDGRCGVETQSEDLEGSGALGRSVVAAEGSAATEDPAAPADGGRRCEAGRGFSRRALIAPGGEKKPGAAAMAVMRLHRSGAMQRRTPTGSRRLKRLEADNVPAAAARPQARRARSAALASFLSASSRKIWTKDAMIGRNCAPARRVSVGLAQLWPWRHSQDDIDQRHARRVRCTRGRRARRAPPWEARPQRPLPPHPQSQSTSATPNAAAVARGREKPRPEPS